MKGQEIGGCRIIRKIGEGGMGIVFEAEQISLGRQVALKLLSAKLDKSDDYEKRFIREARSAACINHPHVVQVYNAGRDGDNLYLIMEFVDGITLQKKIMENPFLPPREIAEIIKSVSMALYEAEKRKIVHRDLKPSNIMLTSSGVLKVMDFGLAKQTDTATHLTSPGKLLGTPFYMSPEQINGEEIDSRSDLYSLGVILYFLLTKKKPFDGDLYTVIQHHVHSPRPDPRNINPDAPEFLRRLYFKMTKVNRNDRFRSFKDVIKEIDAFLLSSAPQRSEKPLDEYTGTRAVSREEIRKRKEEKKDIHAPSQKSRKLRKSLAAACGLSLLAALAFMTSKYFLSKPQESTDSASVKQEDAEAPVSVVSEKQPEEKISPSKLLTQDIRVEGGKFVRFDSQANKVFFKEVCGNCGYEGDALKEMTGPSPDRKRLHTFTCPKCGKKQLTIVENRD